MKEIRMPAPHDVIPTTTGRRDPTLIRHGAIGTDPSGGDPSLSLGMTVGSYFFSS
jgi:hypothetical protein